jgi:uncharacterized membrane protein YtjA (UPF0391 family)
MLSWALAFFVIAIIAALFGFSGVSCTPAARTAPPAWWKCPDFMVCTPTPPAPQIPADFVCPDGWTCKLAEMASQCPAAEIAKVLFVVFVVLFLVSLVAGLLRRP